MLEETGVHQPGVEGHSGTVRAGRAEVNRVDPDAGQWCSERNLLILAKHFGHLARSEGKDIQGFEAALNLEGVRWRINRFPAAWIEEGLRAARRSYRQD